MSRRFDHLPDTEAFVTTVDQGSLTAAASAMATTPSVISRAIARLEKRLGVQLLHRSTRRLSLTDAGRLYLKSSRTAFTLIEDGERAIQDQGGELSGTVRLSVPTTYGHYRLPAILKAFVLRHPRVQIELSVSNRNVDLVAEGFDMAIRLGDPPDSGLVARKLEDAALGLFAAPDYVQTAGIPQSLEELATHRCMAFVMPSTGRVLSWLFKQGGKNIEWSPPTALRVCDDVLGVVSLAEQGLGICQIYDFIVSERVRQGRLVELLHNLRGRTRPFSLIYAPHRMLSAASRALIDVLTATD